jgi:hypothetical protein
MMSRMHSFVGCIQIQAPGFADNGLTEAVDNE